MDNPNRDVKIAHRDLCHVSIMELNDPITFPVSLLLYYTIQAYLLDVSFTSATQAGRLAALPT
jgi:hypothetical protein